MQGMLDPIIITQMLRNTGAKPALIREAMPEIQRAAERFYLRVCPALHDKHCPAVQPTLEKLERRGVLLALVTGNLDAHWMAEARPRRLKAVLPLRRLWGDGEDARGPRKMGDCGGAAQAMDRPHGAGFVDRRCDERHYRRQDEWDSLHLGRYGDYSTRGIGRARAGLSTAELAGTALADVGD